MVYGAHVFYDPATASVHINGTFVGSIPIRSGVRQGCPCEMDLFALSSPPYSRTREQHAQYKD
jgi:hypothetical protein